MKNNPSRSDGYTHDYAGRTKTMTTWQNFAGDQGAAISTWNYDSQRGFLSGKRYNDNTGPDYNHTPAGRLYTHTWARNITTTYTTNTFGDVARVTYSDSTPGVTNGFDRLGRLIAVTNGPNVISRSYDLSGALLSETLNGVTVSNSFDSIMRRTNCALLDSQSALLTSTGYGYDPASRLQSATSAGLSANYSYLANSPLVEQILFQQNGTTRMTTTKQHDFLNRLTRISSVPSGYSAVNFDYTYNQANQRTNVVLGPDGSRWVFSYDSLGQVISGKKYWPDGTPVAGQQFEYTFDDIGNRKLTKAGGDAAGGNLRGANYTNNLLNQITGRDIPGTNDIIGIAHSSATVTVNGQSPYRKGEYYQTGLTMTNRDFALYPYVTSTANLAGVPNAATGRVYVARSPEVLSYDADGNLTNDGRWAYAWDAENRLVRMVSRSDAPSDSWLSLTFAYDAQGRRISKIVSNWTAGAWFKVTDQRFMYDGWNLIAILNSSFSLLTSFTWGLDLSGSSQGAGGVGGLISVNNATNVAHFAAFDGNGNVIALVNATNGTVSANYEYGPFGELLRATGPMAKANPFRFSTKYHDDDTDLIYYGYRYYNCSAGRWLTRDPIEERGGIALYLFLVNNQLNRIDRDGRISVRSVWVPPVDATRPWTGTSTVGDCGDFAVFWQFSLDSPSPEEGYIVQKVTILDRFITCGEKVGITNTSSYWEYWNVPANSASPVPPQGGRYYFTDQDSQWGTSKSKGVRVSRGEVKFFFKSHPGVGDLAAPGSGWGPNGLNGGDARSQAVPSTRTPPPWWNDPSDHGETDASRITAIRWDCCCSSKKDQVRIFTYRPQ
jgi:RHS repeat-associated protein